MHFMEEDLKRNDIPLNIKRLLSEAIFVCNAFTYYNGESPYDALLGRQPQCLPDLEAPDFADETTEMSGHRKE